MAHSKLYRSFIILQEDEKGHSIAGDKPLSGYAKIEVKNDRCKIAFYAQNLKHDYDKCHMVLICSKKDAKQNINLGNMNINEQGKAEATVEHMANNIGGTGVNYEKVVGAALCKQLNGRMVILMCGFLNGEQPEDDWKKYKMMMVSDGAKGGNQPVTQNVKVTKKVQEKKIVKEEPQSTMDQSKQIDMNEAQQQMMDNMKPNIMNNANPNTMSEDMDYNTGEYQERTLESKYDDYEREINNTRVVEDDIQLKGTMGDFFGAVVEGFDPMTNMTSDIKNTKWYRIPVKSIDDMLNITNYNKYTVVYYPMVNYYPYIKKKDYFLLGLKCDEEGNVKYLIYAVPGNKDKDSQPYGGKTGFVTWTEDPNDPNSGYWLMFYDFKNSMIVIPMK
ncbi:hypothetical protein SAMN02745163_03118 [Clostridium cavendishii DSM 21758]|uniref:DUF7922 domain-containing protein n=1 Tax=Clostridium cavendishii DSM 21758 TaxID=1121302 RepID=A0A1M6PDK1_9CLOT|nr:hypothetical protein [Clostridium cavendishii]SHK06011.1 hypothetical protein SAMN02745163_03118 [Clostridium cavendishii DSM 21758]